MKKTKIINLVGGPGSGKTTFACLFFSYLKMNGVNCEYISEFAKTLVWEENYDLLNDQYYVSKKQFELFNNLNGKVDYIITDCSLLQGIYYNQNNPDNVSDRQKTEIKILEYIKKFENIYIFINRNNNIVYETEGRIQSEKEAKDIDVQLKNLLRKYNFEFLEYYN